MMHPPIDPRCDDLGYSSRRYFVDSFFLRHVAEIQRDSLVLDLGGTNVEKRGQFDIKRFPLKVVSANCSPTKSPDVLAFAEDLPFSEGAFQVVICSELLEHVYSPGRVLDEVYRVLEPGGVLLITVPFLVGVHADPADFGRYTEHFWRTLLPEKRFQIQSLERHGAFWSVACDLLRTLAVSKRHVGFWRRALALCFNQALRLGRRKALVYEELHRQADGRFFTDFTTGYGIVARKR